LTATPSSDLYTLSLHDALPILLRQPVAVLVQKGFGGADRGAWRQGQAGAALADQQAQPARARVPDPAHRHFAAVGEPQRPGFLGRWRGARRAPQGHAATLGRCPAGLKPRSGRTYTP